MRVTTPYVIKISVIVIFMVTGLILLSASQAAVFQVAGETEAGAIGGNAGLINGPGASGANLNTVRFGLKASDDVRVFAYRMFGGPDDPSRIGAARMKDYKVYLLSPYMVQTARSIKQQNPQAVILMYKDPTSTRTTAACVADAAGQDWGVDYCDTDKNHSGWFMTKAGQRFQYNGYGGHWHLDVGASGYKERYTSNTLLDLRRNPVWSGIFLDNMMADIKAYVPGNVYPDQYTNNAAAQNAYAGFMDYVGQQLKAAGFQSLGNNNGARLVPGLWARYTAGATGGYDEFWTTFGNDANLPAYDNVGWDAQLAQADLLSTQAKLGIFTAQTNGGTCKTCQRYGYASYLLVADARQAYTEGNVDAQTGDWLRYAAMYSWQLGKPVAARSQLQPKLFERKYTNGLVLVNADVSVSRTVSLPKPYFDETGASVNSLTIKPVEGRILRSSL